MKKRGMRREGRPVLCKACLTAVCVGYCRLSCMAFMRTPTQLDYLVVLRYSHRRRPYFACVTQLHSG